MRATPLLLALIAAAPAESPRQRPATLPATLPADPADAARLLQMGSRSVRIHDPSGIVKCNGEYWLFATGSGVAAYRSKDLLNWERAGRAITDAPTWVRPTIPRNRNGNDFWAPDILHHNNRYHLYYSVSSWGKNTSAIALATNPTLDPSDPAYKWTDQGIVIQSTEGKDNFNAIDPAPFLDADGKLWLSFGSFWGGIKMVELDPTTGKRIAPDSPIHSLAQKAQIEGPYIFRHDNRYYLLVAWGWCCRGVSSTYNIRVGRAEKVTGPYLDRDGTDLLKGGGTLLLGTDGPFIGPGQPGFFSEGGKHYVVCHFYDATQRGRSTLAIRPLTFTTDGWPVIPREGAAPAEP